MKIKLQNYGLISSEWIDKEIERLKEPIPYWDGIYISAGQLERVELLEKIKEQLIPSEKLAEVSFNTGFNSGMELSKQEFLESEIEIL